MPDGLPVEVVILLAALLALLAMIGGALYAVSFGPRAKLKRRMAQVVAGGHSRKGGKAAQPLKRKSIQTKLKEVEDSRNKRRGYKLRESLVQAGLTIGVKEYVVFSALGGILGMILWMVLNMPPLGIPLVGLSMGLGMPRMVLNFLIQRRLKKFTTLFADAIDVIVRGIRSGLPVGECINMIGREMPDPVGTEFRLIAEGQRLGLTMEEAMLKANERVPTPELRFFTIVISIQQQTGGNLAETLGKLSDVLRQRKKMRDKVQAMSSEAKSSAGIIGSLPILVGGLLGLIAPHYIGLLFTTDTGHFLIAISLGVMGMGIFVMKQMINFEM